jgi:hypothetical protein
MGNRKKLGETYINFTVPKEYGGANGFQPGSTFKVFTLATALEDGYPLTTTFNAGSPMTFDMADFSNCPGEGNFVGPYTASNSTGTGLFNMYSGTRNSINTYFLQLEEKTGVCKPYELAQQLGVKLTDPKAERYPSFTLGIADASPLEMAEGLRDVRGSRHALHVPPGHPDPVLQRERGEGLPAAVHPGAASERRRRRERRAARRHRGRLRVRPAADRRRRRQDRHHAGAEGGLVLRLHRPLRGGRDDRRYRPRGQTRLTGRQDHRRRLHLRGVGPPGSRHPSGATR